MGACIVDITSIEQQRSGATMENPMTYRKTVEMLYAHSEAGNWEAVEKLANFAVRSGKDRTRLANALRAYYAEFHNA